MMNFHRKLPIPQEVKKEYPLSERMVEVKAARDEEIRAVFDGSLDKFILVIGPCSADHREPVLEYISRLRRLDEQVSDKIILIPRIYTNKPRTTGQGYKGMLHQPDARKDENMLAGIVAIRQLHTNVVKQSGFTSADEMLYPENYRYLSDLPQGRCSSPTTRSTRCTETAPPSLSKARALRYTASYFRTVRNQRPSTRI